MSKSLHGCAEATAGAEQVKDEMLARYHATRVATEELCRGLEVEDMVCQTMADVSPTKWHLAHTTWFFETFILVRLDSGYEVYDRRYRDLFNSYYNSVGQQFDRPKRGYLSRPTVREIMDFRAHVDAAIERLLENGSQARVPEFLKLVEIGIHHEQQHQELILTDLKHVFASNPLLPIFRSESRSSMCEAEPLGWHEYEGGVRAIGESGDGFSFDNERPRHEVLLQPFRLASRLVTCGEYLEFIEAGGYDSPEFWLSDGWEIIRARSWSAPLYWRRIDATWYEFTLTGMRPVRAAEPVCHVSFYEADAYARWKGLRLPSEEEWEVAAADVGVDGNFVDSERFHPRPSEFSGAADVRPRQMFGDVWEWTSSPYLAYPGYARPVGALGEYNAKFMSNRFVLRGGSCATPRNHMRATYRNFFAPDARWQFMGIRLADSLLVANGRASTSSATHN